MKSPRGQMSVSRAHFIDRQYRNGLGLVMRVQFKLVPVISKNDSNRSGHELHYITNVKKSDVLTQFYQDHYLSTLIPVASKDVALEPTFGRQECYQICNQSGQINFGNIYWTKIKYYRGLRENRNRVIMFSKCYSRIEKH